MPQRFHLPSTSGAHARSFLRVIPWKMLILMPVLIALVIPIYLYASHFTNNVVPGATQFFYQLSAPIPVATPTPMPALPTLPTLLPRAGSILYTVQDGDSCDSILNDQMHLARAGEVFSDVKPETVKALNATVGQDCHAIQPGMVLPLFPQYPLIAFGGIVLKVAAANPQQVLPTPLITIPGQQQQKFAPDCSGGCLLTVRLAPQVVINLAVQTTLSIYVNSWIWSDAMLARKSVSGFANYPYVDPNANLNGMSLSACNFVVGDQQDNTALSCDQVTPNTIVDDQGAWLFGVIGQDGLDHWHYKVHAPTGTQLLLWLSMDKSGNLQYQSGNPAYSYNNATHVYVKLGNASTQKSHK